MDIGFATRSRGAHSSSPPRVPPPPRGGRVPLPLPRSRRGGRRAVRDEERGHPAPLEVVDHLPKASVQRGLPREADRHVRRMPGLQETLPRHAGMALVPAEEGALGLEAAVDDGRGVVRLEEAVGSPFLGAPAEHASEVARVDRRRHLQAAVALDSVERLLVAADALREARLRPVAQLDPAVLPDDSVALALEDLLPLGVHRALVRVAWIKGFRAFRTTEIRGPGPSDAGPAWLKGSRAGGRGGRAPPSGTLAGGRRRPSRARP